MQPAAIELRQDVREGATRPAPVLLAPIKLLDLCAGRALVEATSWLAPGRRRCLELGPGALLTGSVTDCALARVAVTSPPRAVYNVGFRFDPPTPEARRAVMRLVAALQRLGAADPLPIALRIV